jgi:hypothetical protein
MSDIWVRGREYNEKPQFRQGWGVSAGWGCGAIAAALVTIIVIVLFSSISRL